MKNDQVKRGRPRDEGRRRAILKAAVELLDQRTFQEISIEDIATKAGVGRPTVYRWWPNKAAILMDAFLELTEPHIEFKKDLSPPEALRNQICTVASAWTGKLGKSIATIVAAAQFDCETAEAYRTRFVNIRRAKAAEIINQGINSGIFRADIDVEVALDLLYGPLYFRLLVKHKPLSVEYAEQLVDLALKSMLVNSDREKI